MTFFFYKISKGLASFIYQINLRAEIFAELIFAVCILNFFFFGNEEKVKE